MTRGRGQKIIYKKFPVSIVEPEAEIEAHAEELIEEDPGAEDHVAAVAEASAKTEDEAESDAEELIETDPEADVAV